MSKRKVSVEDKIYAVNLYLDGKESQHQIASMFDVCTASVQQWIRNYESMGADAFTLKGNKKYSKELKQQVLSRHLPFNTHLKNIISSIFKRHLIWIFLNPFKKLYYMIFIRIVSAFSTVIKKMSMIIFS